VSAPIATGSAGFLARFEALRDTLPGDPAVRAAAAEAFRASGLPGAERGRRPVEAWKYTSLRPLADARFGGEGALTGGGTSASIALPVMAGLDPANHPMTTKSARTSLLGRMAGSSPAMTEGTEGAEGVTAIAARHITFHDGHHHTGDVTRFADSPDFGSLANPLRDPLVALNTMLATDGAVIDIPAGADCGTIVLAHAASSADAFHPRHTIHLGAGARLTILETAESSAACLHNPVTTITVGAGAHLTHVRIQNEHVAAFHLATILVDIADHATYDGFTLNLGARMTRTEYQVRLSGPHAVAHMNGAQLLTGNQHADFTSVVRHAEPHGTSRQTVKNVLAGRSRGVFQGRIEVARGAQKTDGYQMNQALLLSPDAEIDTKPELEIFADDVKCSHGATIGELDADQMFYLRARGIAEPEARAILVRAFLTEALEAVTDASIRAILEAGVQGWWERQAA